MGEQLSNIAGDDHRKNEFASWAVTTHEWSQAGNDTRTLNDEADQKKQCYILEALSPPAEPRFCKRVVDAYAPDCRHDLAGTPRSAVSSSGV